MMIHRPKSSCDNLTSSWRRAQNQVPRGIPQQPVRLKSFPMIISQKRNALENLLIRRKENLQEKKNAATRVQSSPSRAAEP